MASNPNFRKTSAKQTLLAKINKLKNTDKNHFTVKEAATVIGKSEDTISRWCQESKLQAKPITFGKRTTFKLTKNAILSYFQECLNESEQSKSVTPTTLKKYDHKSLLEPFEKALLQGVIGNRPFSPRTVAVYRFYAEWMVENYGAITVENLGQALLDIPVEQFCKREKLHRVTVAFTKFLIKQDLARMDNLSQLKGMTPKRHMPPKKTTVDEKEIAQLLKHCTNVMDKVIIVVLSQTGLRASEFCSLTLGSVDLKKNKITVIGKGNKRRSVGMTQDTRSVLQDYLKTKPTLTKEDYLFCNDLDKPMDRWGLSHRLEKISKKAKVPVNPHALRRAFVTINANKGRSLVMLQHACGHEDIQTTRGYCMTTEQQVIDAMAEWD